MSEAPRTTPRPGLFAYETAPASAGEVEILRFLEAGDPNRTAVVWRFCSSQGWDIQVPLIWGENVS